MSTVLTDALNCHGPDDSVPPFYAAVDTQQLQYNSALCTSEWNASMLSAFIYLLSKQISPDDVCRILFSRSSLSAEFQDRFNFEGVDSQNLVVFGLAQFYEVASAGDAKYRHFWLTQLTNSLVGTQAPQSSKLIAISERLSNLVGERNADSLSKSSLTSCNLPWDSRRLSKFVVPAVNSFEANRFSLVIGYTVLKHRRLLEFNHMGHEDFDVTLSQYSLACSSGN